MNELKLGLHPLSTADRAGLWSLIVIGAAIAIVNIALSVMRIFEVLLGESISVTADLSDYEPMMILEDGKGFPISIDTVTFHAERLPTDAAIAAIAQPALLILMTLGIAAAFGYLARNILRGRVFSRGNTAALVTAWSFGIVGMLPQPFLQWVVAAGALEEAGIPDLGANPAEVLSLQFSPFPFIALLIMIAITTHAFSVGTKIQRETEGLV